MAGLAAAYVLLFPYLAPWFGTMARAFSLPYILLAAWLGGIWVGALTALFNLFLNIWLHQFHDMPFVDGAMGASVSIMLAVAVGYARHMARQANALKGQAEKGLRLTQQQMDVLFRQSPYWLIISTLDQGILLEVNDSFLADTGFTREEALGQTSSELGFWGDPKTRQQAIAQLHEKGHLRDFEVAYHGPKGLSGVALWSAELVEADGQQCLISIMRDVTDQRRNERELAESRERYSRIFHTIDYAMLVLDAQGRVREANRAAMETLGARGGDLVGSTFDQLCPAGWEDRCHALLQGLGEGNTHEGDWAALDRQGRMLTASLNLTAFKQAGEDRYLAVIRDVSQARQAEKALREERERFQLLADESPLGVTIIGEDGTFKYANPKWTATLGYTLEDVPHGRDWFRLAYPDPELRQRAFTAWKDDLREKPMGEARPRTFEVTCKDGQRKTILFLPVTMSNGDQLVMHQDITEQVRAARELEQSEKRYRDLLNGVADPVVVYDRGGRPTYVNQAFVDTYGWTLDELAGRMIDFVPREEIDATGRAWRRQLSDGQTRFTTRRLTRRGEVIAVDLSGTNLTDQNGDHVGTVVLHRNITAQQRAEAALRENEERVRAILEANPDPVVVYDQSGSPSYLNPAFSKVFGWTLGELRGQRIPFVPPDQQAITSRQVQRLLREGIFEGLETRRLTKDGREVDVFVSAARIMGPGDEVAGMVVNLTDITSAKRMEAELRHSQKMEAVGTLAGGVAHDFNNILQIINGYLEELNVARGQDPVVAQPVERMAKAVQRASELVRRLLTFSRKVDTRLGPVWLNKEVEQAVQIIRRAMPPMISIQKDLEDGLPPIEADDNQIEQVLLNLAVNAGDAMPEGGTLLFSTRRVRVEEDGAEAPGGLPPGDYVQLIVADSGQGMPPEVQKQIFDPFFTTKGPGKGTGLGLSTVYGIVRGHGGHIAVRSQPRGGTEFTIWLPAGSEAGAVRARGAAAPDGELGGGETILMVDDEREILDLGTEALSNYGYKVLVAGGGMEALSLYAERWSDIDLVVLDMGMPGMSGAKCLEAMLEVNPRVKAIIASGYLPESSLSQELNTNAVGFLPKPYRIKELAAKVRQSLDMGRQPPAAS